MAIVPESPLRDKLLAERAPYEFKLGDFVVDEYYGRGVVTMISSKETEYPVIVNFPDSEQHYTKDGRYHTNGDVKLTRRDLHSKYR